MFNRTTMLGIVALALASCVAVPRPHPPFRIAGVTAATIDATGKSSTRAEGCAAFAEDGLACVRKLSPDNMIRVASISKLVVAIGVMRLVEQHKLDLDRDVSDYLGFALRNPAFAEKQVTLRQLLSHTSSLRDGDGYAIPLGGTLRDEAAIPTHWDAAHQPGEYFTYANFSFVVVGTVMEAVTGERFDRLMHGLVLKPLRIEGCFNWAACSPALASRAATLYRTGPDETQWNPDGPWIAQVDDLQGRKPVCPVLRSSTEAPCDLASYRPGTNGALFSPHGGLRISVKGLTKIARLILNNGRSGRVRLLAPSSIEVMLRPRWKYDPQTANGDTDDGAICAYGLSVHLLNVVRHSACRDDLFADGRQRIGHQGEAYGLYGGLWIDTAARRAAIFLVTGTSRDPTAETPLHSAFTRLEEQNAATMKD